MWEAGKGSVVKLPRGQTPKGNVLARPEGEECEGITGPGFIHCYGNVVRSKERLRAIGQLAGTISP